MPWGRQSGYHNLRNQEMDERAQAKKPSLARSSISTHAIDDQLAGRIPARADQPGSFAAGNLVEDPSR